MEEFKGDKRTKEYKAWKKRFEEEQAKKPDGLGDVVENVLQSKPVKPITEAIKGVLFKDKEDCGCEERKKVLNKMFLFNKPSCLTEDEYNHLKDFFAVRRTTVKLNEREKLYEIYNRVFGTVIEVSNCPSCISKILRSLKSVLTTYK